MDFKVCHHGFQGMPSWTTRFARRESFLQDSTCLNASLFLPISPYLLSGPVFYSVEIHSNVIMYERPLVSHLLPPHPEIERERYSLMQKLRQSYRELCYARESTPQMLTARERWYEEDSRWESEREWDRWSFRGWDERQMVCLLLYLFCRSCNLSPVLSPLSIFILSLWIWSSFAFTGMLFVNDVIHLSKWCSKVLGSVHVHI